MAAALQMLGRASRRSALAAARPGPSSCPRPSSLPGPSCPTSPCPTSATSPSYSRPLSTAACGASGVLAAPLCALQGFFDALHVGVGLPWWAAVVGGAVLLRSAVTLPVAVYQQRNAARMELDAAPYVAAWRDKLAVQIRADFRAQDRPFEEFQAELGRQLRRKAWQVYREHGCNPLGPILLPIAQIPLWITVSLCIRRMCAMPLFGLDTLPEPVLGFATGGLPWCLDLAAADPTWTLPCLVGAFHLANIQFRELTAKGEGSALQRGVTHLLRAGSVGMVLVAAQLPSALALYWAASGAYSLVQNIVLEVPAVRRALRIRPMPSDSKTLLHAWTVAAREGRLAKTVLRLPGWGQPQRPPSPPPSPPPSQP